MNIPADILIAIGGSVTSAFFVITAMILKTLWSEIMRLRSVRHDDRDQIAVLDGKIQLLEDRVDELEQRRDENRRLRMVIAEYKRQGYKIDNQLIVETVRQLESG